MQVLVFIVLLVVFVFWLQGLSEAKDKRTGKEQEWKYYLSKRNEKECFAIANDKSGTKFDDDQRKEAFKRGCELRRIRELGS